MCRCTDKCRHSKMKPFSPWSPRKLGSLEYPWKLLSPLTRECETWAFTLWNPLTLNPLRWWPFNPWSPWALGTSFQQTSTTYKPEGLTWVKIPGGEQVRGMSVSCNCIFQVGNHDMLAFSGSSIFVEKNFNHDASRIWRYKYRRPLLHSHCNLYLHVKNSF